MYFSSFLLCPSHIICMVQVEEVVHSIIKGGWNRGSLITISTIISTFWFDTLLRLDVYPMSDFDLVHYLLEVEDALAWSSDRKVCSPFDNDQSGIAWILLDSKVAHGLEIARHQTVISRTYTACTLIHFKLLWSCTPNM